MESQISAIISTRITDGLLINSSVPEADHAAYAAATTYASGDFCISTVTHRVYQSQKDGNTGHDPTDINNRAGATVWWTDYGPTNKWAMFDDEANTQTVHASPLTVVLRPGGFNAVYLGGLDADALSITVKDAPDGNVVYSYTGELEASAPGDYDEYFFGRFKPQTDFLASEIDQYNNAEITVTLTRATGQVKCGVLVVGDQIPLGQTQYGAKAKPKTFSYIKTDDFGRTKIVRRKATTDMSLSAWLDLSEANVVLATIRELLDVPVVWIGTGLPEYEGLRIFGLGSGEISYDHPKDCLLTLSVQGLI